MIQKENLINDIRRGLTNLQSYIQSGGSLNLTDTNVHAEGFVAGLMNILYDLNLVTTNKRVANYPCIDLIDEGKRLGVQVTSEKGARKLAKTIECLKKHKLAGKIRQLKVFSLVTKQMRYTVKTKCSGIAFDWHNDVLDFNDAIRAANNIDNLAHLQRVHNYVIEAISSVFPEYASHQPPLGIPTTEPSSTWLAFSSRSTGLIGRDDESDALSAFLNATPKFSWWLMTGPAGSGKSRMALELCKRIVPGWYAGFLRRVERVFDWSKFRPAQNTLIVIDYVASRAEEISDMVLTLSRASVHFTAQVRVLLVERHADWWLTIFRRSESLGETAEIEACKYGEPLALLGLSQESLLKLAKDVARIQGGKWNARIAANFLARLYQYDPTGRPLYAMIVARYLEFMNKAAATTDLLQVILTREGARRRKLVQQSDALKRIENLLLLATLVGGLLPKDNSFRHLAAHDVSDLLPDVSHLDEDLYNDIAGSPGGTNSLAGLQPDILGERFVLNRLSETGIAAENARRLLLAAWSIQPSDVVIVAIRCAHDFSAEPALHEFFDLPIDSVESRVRWAEMVGGLVAQVGVSGDSFAMCQHRKLVSLADTHPDEQELQDRAALADYNMGVSTMLTEQSLAAERFDAAISRVGAGSLIGIMASLNRGTLYVGEDEKAIQAWTTVIESPRALDEMRACALNNRANVYANRGDHDSANRDRTTLLALKNTSPDRRFVALSGRSESFSAIENYQAALNDLNTILQTTDIAPSDKLSAMVERAVIARQLGRRKEARAALEAVLNSKMLPMCKSKRARDFLKNAEHSRKRGDYLEAERQLSDAVRDLDAHSENDIRLLIIGAMLIEDLKCHSDEISAMWEQLRDAFRRRVSRTRFAKPKVVWAHD